MKSSFYFIVVVLVVLLAGGYFILRNNNLSSEGFTAPTDTEGCERMLDLSDYCSGLTGASVVYVGRGQTVATGNGATTSYDGIGTGSCQWGKVNAASQPLTAEETANFKSIGLVATFYESDADAMRELQEFAVRGNLTVTSGEVRSIGSLSSTPNYPFDDRLIMKNNGKLNVMLLQFSANGLSPYCSSSEEEALLNFFQNS